MEDRTISLSAKEEAKRLIDHLPDQATLNDIMYELYVKQKIQAGLQSAKEGQITSHDEVKRQLLSRAN
jgi:predicted transcriptional regulator